MLQALLFDCDGIIADSETHWNAIDREHLAAFGVPDYAGELKQRVIGTNFPTAIGFYREHFGISAPLAEMVEHRTQVAAHFYANDIPIYPGTLETLRECRALNLKMAVATSSEGRLIRPFLQRHNIAQFFDFVVTGEQVENGKPHPDIYLKAAAGVQTAPANCLVIEDALAGLEAGNAAGALTVALPDPRWHDVETFAGRATFQIRELSELVALVKRLVEEPN